MSIRISRELLWLSCLLAGSVGAQDMLGTNLGAIPDGTAPGPGKYGAPREVRFTSNSDGTVDDVQLYFKATHPFVGDLKVTLVSPQGIEHLLFERTGAIGANDLGSNSNLVSTDLGYGFFDSAPNNWWTVATIGDADIPSTVARSVIAGPAAPPPAVTSMKDAFLNRPVKGTWTLRFEDGWAGDTGDVEYARLIVNRLIDQRTVTKVADTNDGVCNSDCSLREAIATAGPGSEVRFDPAVFDRARIIFLGSQLLVDKNISIVGPGAHRLTISTANASRVFRVTGARVSLTGLRIADGAGTDAGCLSASGGNLLLYRVEISNCRGTEAGALNQSVGGSLVLSESSITGSQAQDRAGGLVLNSPAHLLRSTISGNLNVSNTSNRSGGVYSASSLVVIDSTIVRNTARGTGSDQAGGISRSGPGVLTLRNSVVAGNVGGTTDIVDFGGTVVSAGYNAIGRVGALAAIFAQPGDQFGVQGAALDPVLSPLSYHGGTLPVHVPLPRSPLLDQGNSTRLADVRGVPVTDLVELPAAGGNNADIGAVEQSPITVSTLAATGPGSLQQALLDAPVAPAVTDIFFNTTLTPFTQTIRIGSQLSADRNVSIHGPGAQRLTIDANRQARTLAVQPGRLVSVSGMTLADGNGFGSPSSGGGGVVVAAPDAHLSVVDSVISGGRALEGSAILVTGGAALWMRGSTVVGNGLSASSRAISGLQDSVIQIETSTISGNRGYALALLVARGTLFRSTVHANDGTSALDSSVSTLLVSDSIVAGQRSGNDLASTGYLSGGHNLIGSPGTATAFVQSGDQVGSNANPTDPRLSPLAIYSGQVPVHVPLVNSPATDKGRGRIADQRGLSLFDSVSIVPATNGDNSDIGAVETQLLLVNTLNDSGPNSLRQAILDANANGSGVDDIVFVDGQPGPVVLLSALPAVTGNTNLIGNGANVRSITRNPNGPAFRLLAASGPSLFGQTQLGISGLTFLKGSDASGGAIEANRMELHLTEVEFETNAAPNGGAINVVDANAVLRNCTFTGNSATDGGALRIRNKLHRVRIEQCTFSGNTASSGAGISFGGADTGGFAELEVLSSTLAGNAASSSGGGIRTATQAGAQQSRTILKNTLLTGNPGGNLVLDTSGGPGSVLSQGFNLSNTAEPLLTEGTDLTGANAALGPFADNGGPVRTHALLDNSAAIDAGVSTSVLFDARGQQRPRDFASKENPSFGDGGDIGAVELQVEPATPPTATSSPANVTTAGGSSTTFTVTYIDGTAINIGTLGTGDVAVSGPNGFNVTPSFVGVSPAGNGTPRIATYGFTPPGGSWDSADDGTYTVSVQASQVAGTSGLFVAAGAVGSFSVTIGSLDVVFKDGFEQ